jgi:hypothetical protein
MNQRGNLAIIILMSFLVLALLPPLIMMFFKPADLLMRLILIFMIFSTVRSYLGSNVMSLIISGALIYLLVIKHAYITASLYVFFYILLGFQFLSVIIWGLGTGFGTRR